MSNLLNIASLVLTPSSYKEGKLYSVIPSNGNGDFTVTRATTATRVNSAGLVDLVPYNLLSYSEDFTNAFWTKQSGTTIVSTNNIAPNGELKASFVTGSGTSGILQVVSGLFPSTTYIRTIYLKGAVGGEVVQVRDPQVGTLNPKTLTTSWARYDYVVATDGTGVSGIWIDDIPASGIYIWGAQLVQGSNALPYQKTETRLNIPRIDYSLGGCPNILLEPQRTNLITWSQDLSNAVWAKANGTQTSNVAVAPDGTLTADLFTPSNIDGYLWNTSYSYSGGPINFTFSVWLKSATGTSFSTEININNSSRTTITVTDQWQRFSCSGLYSGVSFVVIGGFNSLPVGENIYVWGAQLEQGAYPTSYIPTTTASVTRNADIISRSNIFTNGLITAAGGTWFVELRNNRSLIRDAFSALGVGDTTSLLTNSLVIIPTFNSSRYRVGKYIAGVYTQLYITTTDTSKIAIKWNGTTADIFENGVKVISATAFTTVNMQNLNGTFGVSTYINQMALFPTPLSDDELEALTGQGFDTYAAMASYYNYTLQ